MSMPLGVIMVSVAGAGLGAINAAALWWTVLATRRVRHPGRLLVGSFPVRIVLTVGPLVLLAGPHPERLIGGLAMFVIARLLTVRALSRLAGPAQGEPA
ncbi:MAG: ATP synthase subunit I [Phycisphaerales bacterium JB039]